MNTLLLGGDSHEKIVNVRDERGVIRMAVKRDPPIAFDEWQQGPTELDIAKLEVYRYSRLLSKKQGGTPVFVHESIGSESDEAFVLAMQSYEYRTRMA